MWSYFNSHHPTFPSGERNNKEENMKKFRINIFTKVLSFVLVTMLILPMKGDTFSLTGIFSKIALKHSPLKYFVPGKRISLELNLKQEAIKTVRCYFRAKGKDFNFVEMGLKKGSKDVYTAILPAAAENTEGIEYAFMTVDEKNQLVKTQTYDVGMDAKKSVPSYQNVASEGQVKVFSELGETALEGFSDEIVMDIVESSLRYGFNAGFFSSTSVASAGGASGSAATATTTAVTASAPLSTMAIAGIAAAGVGTAAAVSGSGGGSSSSSSSDSSLPGGTGEVKITLQWSATVDADLHVTDPCGNNIYFAAPSATCNGYSASLDLDNTSGGSGAAENVFWTTAPRGTYQYYINYFSGSGSFSYTVTRIVDGVTTSNSGTLSSQGENSTTYSFSR